MFVFSRLSLVAPEMLNDAKFQMISFLIWDWVGLWLPPLKIEPYVSLMNVACNANAIQI